tara:strand:- start:12314 stop:12493 length:180 start_codon:yes stop_codon:yes gene_type:complete
MADDAPGTIVLAKTRGAPAQPCRVRATTTATTRRDATRRDAIDRDEDEPDDGPTDEEFS